jgi:hypothetical protein
VSKARTRAQSNRSHRRLPKLQAAVAWPILPSRTGWPTLSRAESSVEAPSCFRFEVACWHFLFHQLDECFCHHFRIDVRRKFSCDLVDVGADGNSRPPTAIGSGDIPSELNEVWSVIVDGGKTRVHGFIEEEINGQKRWLSQTLTFQDFDNTYVNRSVRIGKKEIDAGRWWAKHPKRRRGKAARSSSKPANRHPPSNTRPIRPLPPSW